MNVLRIRAVHERDRRRQRSVADSVGDEEAVIIAEVITRLGVSFVFALGTQGSSPSTRRPAQTRAHCLIVGVARLAVRARLSASGRRVA